jgi:ribosomal protein S6
MNQYEVMYILRVDQEEQAIRDMIEKFNGVITSNGGTIDSTDEWGKRRLAYPIDYQNEGYYMLQHFSSNPDLPMELERNFRITEGVLRFLVTRIDED